MDVVWLKRDVRLHDHAPLQAACALGSNNPIFVLYLYEQNQLCEPTVHGSHIALTNEGLVDFDQQLCGTTDQQSGTTTDYQFQYLTVCYNNALDVLQHIHSTYTIHRLLAHEETGHYASYQRDRQVRRWCKDNGIHFKEFVQSGVTRRLQSRDNFSKKLQKFLEQPQCPVDTKALKSRIRQLTSNGEGSIRFTNKPLLEELVEIPREHRVDRAARQKGGERAGEKTLQSFLGERVRLYSAGISSPLSSWTSCSRLSIFLTWGHLSLRHVHQATKQRAQALKQINDTGTFRKSLSAFLSRLHWRAHFTQKLESDPLLEKRDLHPSYQPLRRQPGDWNQAYFEAWATGNTGFPFVDACMRCLIQSGWLNFRMRAMLVSFATYNLWLDWKKLAPHLARVFADYEPGIHYPQLQMQSGTTGINAMRVYNVIKQGKDQDPDGVFVKRYVTELRRVPKQYIHEPWKMTTKVQEEHQVLIGNANDENKARYDRTAVSHYPTKIVDEQATARVAKSKVNDIKKMESTKAIAQEVYDKHGSRSRRDDMPNKPKSTKARPKNQPKIQSFLASKSNTPSQRPASSSTATSSNKKRKQPPGQSQLPFAKAAKKKAVFDTAETVVEPKVEQPTNSWACRACTFLNDNPLGLACSMCGTERGATVVG